MYHQIDNNGFYLGVSKITNEGMEFYTEVPIVGNFIKFKIENGIWIEGATTEEITIAETTQDELFTIQQELDGIALYHRHKERLRRRVLKGNMTLAESKTTRKVLRETHLYLKSGDFDIALDLATAITGQIAKVTTEITWLIGKINNTLAK